MATNEIVLSYHDALIRQSDYKILSTREWINDNLIEFWFEYLQHDLFKQHSQDLLCISPSLSQLIKLTESTGEIGAMVDSLQIQSKQVIILAINDSYSFESVGGSHWSLLVFVAKFKQFHHYDSSENSSNRVHAATVASKLLPLLLPTDKKLNLVTIACNQQEDSYNCGIHVICNAEAVCKQHCNNDSRQISDLLSPNTIRATRDRLIALIDQLRNQ